MAMTKNFSEFNLQVTMVAGAAGTTNIAVSGIATEDQIVSVWHVSTAASVATIADITSEVSITSAGNIQLSTTDTTNDQLIVFWVDRSL